MENTMAPMPAAREALTLSPSETQNPVVKLAALHVEARETARLANLLGRSAYMVLALPVLTLAALAVGGFSDGLVRPLVWTAFMAIATAAIVIAYRHAIGRPFERAALKSFSQDLSAILLFAGFAWGAGTFLAMPTHMPAGAMALFVAVAAASVGLLLREQEMLFRFLAPATVLTSLACVLRPSTSGALDLALVLIVSAAIVGLSMLAERIRDRASEMPELAGLPTA
jgi:hypothetical protein